MDLIARVDTTVITSSEYEETGLNTITLDAETEMLSLGWLSGLKHSEVQT